MPACASEAAPQAASIAAVASSPEPTAAFRPSPMTSAGGDCIAFLLAGHAPEAASPLRHGGRHRYLLPCPLTSRMPSLPKQSRQRLAVLPGREPFCSSSCLGPHTLTLAAPVRLRSRTSAAGFPVMRPESAGRGALTRTAGEKGNPAAARAASIAAGWFAEEPTSEDRPTTRRATMEPALYFHQDVIYVDARWATIREQYCTVKHSTTMNTTRAARPKTLQSGSSGRATCML